METAAILYNRRSEYPLRFRPKGLPQHSGQHEREGDVGAAANASIMIDAQSNLYHFLQHTTPRVLCQSLPKSQIHILASRGSSSHNQCFFSLNDLWDSFDEWSAYGAGVPILYSKESVMQYYVPYLSGIQLYASLESELTTKSRRRLGDDSDGSEIDYRDSNSESSSSDVEIDGPSNHSQWTASDILERNYPGETLLFEYFESAAPSHRAPLFDKVRCVSVLGRSCTEMLLDTCTFT
ncbi:hypothetical protein KP509_24G002800 [Ceratopteris richardii]|uniref:Uncharacterized protein n=1 Tax=Ceratopteris richardii TaxID=49495 RepID=A0A8T2RS65_CERRI|nr:hypothetical protein KP509_24G002800 [Ceratopteris richardii]